MDTPSRAQAARRLWLLLEPIHAVTYFAPEAIDAMTDVGYRGFWMGYFAGRAAPLGPVGPDVVAPLFFGFTHDHIARSLPDAWDFAPPSAATAARLEGSVRALRRMSQDTGINSPTADATRGVRRLAERAGPTGRGLFEAYQQLPWPEEPLAQLWHAATLLREHRGDVHIQALIGHGLTGRQAIVLHAIDVGTPYESYRRARRFEPDEWRSPIIELTDRHLLANGRLTDEGHELRTRVESQTDSGAAAVLTDVADDELRSIEQAVLPLTRSVIARGDIPRLSPIGIDLEQAEALS
ncbi:hypothetical protein HJ590_06310 [Naumannella sp. ID2617S]|nr:hypothetical protein [Naumannella sp. ID2617S]